MAPSSSTTKSTRFQIFWREFVYKTCSAIVSKRVLKSNFKSSKQSKNVWLNIFVDNDPKLAEYLHQMHENQAKTFIIEIFTKIEIKQQRPKPDTSNTNTDDSQSSSQKGALSKMFQKEPEITVKTKNILLERWTVKWTPSNSNVSSGDGALFESYKKGIVTLRSLYTYLLLLPAYTMYKERVRLRNAANEVQYAIHDAPENSTLTFEPTIDTAKHVFDTIQSPHGDLTLNVHYRRDIQDIPKPERILDPNRLITDGYFADKVRARTMSLPASPSTLIKTRGAGSGSSGVGSFGSGTGAFMPDIIGKSLPNNSSVRAPINIKRKQMDPSSPQSKSQPRAIPSRRRSYTMRVPSSQNSHGTYGGTPPFAGYPCSVDSPTIGSSGGSPPFPDMFHSVRNRSISNSSSKSRPSLGSVTPFDSPPMQSYLSQHMSGSHRHSLPKNKDLGNSMSYPPRRETSFGSPPTGGDDSLRNMASHFSGGGTSAEWMNDSRKFEDFDSTSFLDRSKLKESQEEEASHFQPFFLTDGDDTALDSPSKDMGFGVSPFGGAEDLAFADDQQEPSVMDLLHHAERAHSLTSFDAAKMSIQDACNSLNRFKQ
eukprot:CAMPEP_0117445664 /NCGR_PEP_ID=MMETSP0759-20121206/5919_1 /TAXON_ID=63605 /ORGANISM="Percolomonas cosmopolitus, Strain WS" /LENGTH=594 /DNA_ID=CAMNT_0005237861 /DNA_START=448 /DNA_END=2229 /DNA_ORIENTATION=-